MIPDSEEKIQAVEELLDEYFEVIDTLEADSRGRVAIGTEYKDESVKVAVLGVEEDGE